MARHFFEKLKESAISVFPIILVVTVLNFTPLINFSMNEIWAFLFGSALMILGIALFSLGADMSMTPMGKSVGNGLTKTRKVGLLLIVSFIIGLLVTIAEPDLTVLATQVSEIMSSTLLIVVDFPAPLTPKKADILSALYDEVGMDQEAQGIAIAISVDDMTENLRKQLFSKPQKEHKELKETKENKEDKPE